MAIEKTEKYYENMSIEDLVELRKKKTKIRRNVLRDITRLNAVIKRKLEQPTKTWKMHL